MIINKQPNLNSSFAAMWVMKELLVFRVFRISDLWIRKDGPVLILWCYHSHLGLLIPLEFYVTLCGDLVYVFPSINLIIRTPSTEQSTLSSLIHGASLHQIMVPQIHGSNSEIFIPFLSITYSCIDTILLLVLWLGSL